MTVKPPSWLNFFCYSEAIFQRNYTVVYEGKQQFLGDGASGVIELATKDKGAFFHMMATGVTFAPNPRTRIEWSEEGKRENHEIVVNILKMSLLELSGDVNLVQLRSSTV